MKRELLQLTPEVVDAINSELRYQFFMSGTDRADLTDHGPEGQLVTLRCYLREAEAQWTAHSMEQLPHTWRKLAAIAVRALLLYGAPGRKS